MAYEQKITVHEFNRDFFRKLSDDRSRAALRTWAEQTSGAKPGKKHTAAKWKQMWNEYADGLRYPVEWRFS